jgi:hypothetical protein
MTPPSRRLPTVGDAVTVQHLGSTEQGHLIAVEGRRVFVETGSGTEWFELSKTTGRFVRAGEAYFPRLIWRDR